MREKKGGTVDNYMVEPQSCWKVGVKWGKNTRTPQIRELRLVFGGWGYGLNKVNLKVQDSCMNWFNHVVHLCQNKTVYNVVL